MELQILSLYEDLMNLYGERGNLRVLTRALAAQGVTATVHHQSLGDTLSFEGYDLIYMGAGTESARDAALCHLAPYADALKAAADRGAVVLFTGNAWEMLGESVASVHGKTLPGLRLFPFTVTETADRRTTCDAVCTCNFLDSPLVGFFNKCSTVTGVKTPLCTCQMGEGNAPGDPAEGLYSGTIYGTHLTGPVLVRNPHFLRHLMGVLCSRFPDWQETPLPESHADRAYAVALSELSKRMNP